MSELTPLDRLRLALGRLKENALTRDVLIPLLRKLGYHQVDYHGGPHERGVDFVAWRRDPLGFLEAHVGQVKRLRFGSNSSESRSFAGLVTQLGQAVEYEVPNPDGNRYLPSAILLITPYSVDTRSLESHFRRFRELRTLRIIQGPDLARLVSEHLPIIAARVLGHREVIASSVAKKLTNATLLKALGVGQGRDVAAIHTDLDATIEQERLHALRTMSTRPVGDRATVSVTEAERLHEACEEFFAATGLQPITDDTAWIERARELTSRRLEWKDRMHEYEACLRKRTVVLNQARKVFDEARDALRQSDPVLNGLHRELEAFDDASPDRQASPREGATGLGADRSELLAEIQQKEEGIEDLRASLAEAAKAKDAAEVDLKAHEGAEPSSTIHLGVDTISLAATLTGARRSIEERLAELSRQRSHDELCDFLRSIGPSTRAIRRLLSFQGIRTLFGASSSREFDNAGGFAIPCSAQEVLETGLSVVVFGEAGAGKTTTLQMYARSRIQDPGRTSLVIFAPLAQVVRDMGDPRVSTNAPGALAQALIRGVGDYLRTLGIDIDDGLLLDDLAANGGTLILDSVDESIPIAPWIVDALNEVQLLLPSVQCVTSSRVSGGYISDIDYLGVSLRPFSPDSIRSFILAWFDGADAVQSAPLIQHLEDYPDVERVVSNPLLATTMCVLAQFGVRLPTSEIRLYEEWLHLMLGHYDLMRGISRITVHRQDLELLARKIGFSLHSRRVRSLPRQDLIEMADTWIDDPTGSYSRDVLEELIDPCNVLLPMDGGESYGFEHLRYQEYLAAKELISNHSMRAADFLFDQWWHAVMILFAQMQQGTDWIVSHLDGQEVVNEDQAKALREIRDHLTRRASAALGKFLLRAGWMP